MQNCIFEQFAVIPFIGEGQKEGKNYKIKMPVKDDFLCGEKFKRFILHWLLL